MLDGEIDLQGGDLRTQLLTNHKVRDEFRKIWEGLNPDEQTALFEISKNNPDVNKYALDMLQLKKVVERSSPPRIFNDIFATYVRDDAKTPRFSIDWASQTVWRGSERVIGITKREYELLAHLYKNHNRVCAVDELVREVLKDDPLSVTQQKIQSLVNRARRKIEPDLRKPVYLVRHGDEGYRLENC